MITSNGDAAYVPSALVTTSDMMRDTKESRRSNSKHSRREGDIEEAEQYSEIRKQKRQKTSAWDEQQHEQQHEMEGDPSSSGQMMENHWARKSM